VSPTSSAKPVGLQRIGREPVPGAPLLDVEDLHTGFRLRNGLVRAVDGVSLQLQRGQTLGVVGESGSGKTVLSRSIMGILTASNVETQGAVRYEGHDLESLGVKDRRALWGTEMAMVFQDPMTSLNPVLRIGRQITESLRYHLGMSKQEAKEAAIAGLASVGIPAPERRFTEYPHQLSGGMRQRVTIAIALACGPKLLFADEPTTALDVTVQAQILDLLAHQQRERDMGMILVTHDLGVVAGRADNVAVMYAGQIVEMAATADLFANVQMPYTQALLRSIPKLDEASHTRLNVIGGRPPDLINPPAGCRFAPRCHYVQDKCLTEAPPLTESATPGHLYRCWFPVGSPTVKPPAADASASTNGHPEPAAPAAPAAAPASGGAAGSSLGTPAVPSPASTPTSTPEEN
jgi:oligopeptide/dipeptide ABC transporter ATP-binding protein